jgi:hypothetical protein
MTAQPRPFQFSLRAIFIVMTALAVVCSGLFAGPVWATVLTGFLLVILTAVAFTVAVVYGRGYLRTFSVGAIFPCGMLSAWLAMNSYYFIASGELQYGPSGLGTSMSLRARVYVGIITGSVLTATLVCGLFAMLVRWVVERSQRTEPEPSAADPEAGPGDDGETPDGPVTEV